MIKKCICMFWKLITRNKLIKDKHDHLTEGSKNAVKPVSPLIRAKTKETSAAAINILTSKSSNCLKTNFQKGVPVFSNVKYKSFSKL